MTYEANGKQYVVICAGGRKVFTKLGDYVVAYALSNRQEQTMATE
jgi:quinoprotein glucose dehydrogenase